MLGNAKVIILCFVYEKNFYEEFLQLTLVNLLIYEGAMKTFVGPRLRQLRRDHGHTQADMASRLGVSAAYVNLMEHNQRSLSVRVLVGLLEAYGVDWQDLVNDVDNKSFDDLRAAIKDPIFGDPAARVVARGGCGG